MTTHELIMRKITVLLHMLVYSLLWGSIIGAIAVAVPFFLAGGLGYTFLFALVGVAQGLLAGAITGLLVGVLTCTFYFPPQNATEYKLLIGLIYALASALCIFVVSGIQFIAPEVNGGQYVDPVRSLLVSVLIPSLLMGLLSIPVSQRLAAWFLVQQLVA